MDSQAAHHIGQRELFQHGFAQVPLVRETRGLDLRDRVAVCSWFAAWLGPSPAASRK